MREFEDDPRVVTAIISQFETVQNLQTFWSNLYLRGQMLYDPSSVVGNVYYQQPYGGVPFSRGWIIGADQTVVMPIFGYDPQYVIDTIHELVAEIPKSPDINDDGVVNAIDLDMLLNAWGACPNQPSHCAADLDNDGEVGPSDLAIVLGSWG